MSMLYRVCIGLFLVMAFSLSGCGGTGGTTTVSGTIKVQLTKVSAPTSAYSVPTMWVTIRDPKGVTRSAMTDANGIATFSDSACPTGIYSVTRVAGADVTGTAVNTPGREFVKTAPITSATPLIEYAPINAFITINAGGTYTISAPVPDIRQVWMVKRESVSAGGNDNPNYASNSAGDFYGRIILSNIHFNPNYSDAINIWSGSGRKFKLFVTEAQNLISNTYDGSVSLGNLAEDVVAWPYAGPISLEVPSAADWAFASPNMAADATKSQNGNAAYSFGQFAGGLSSIISIYNNGVTHSPSGTNAMTYEIHRFDPPY